MDEFAAGRFARRNPVDVAVTGVALVMVNVDEQLPLLDEISDGAEAFVAGAIGGDDEIERFAGLGFLKISFGIEKSVFRGNGILIPTDNLLSFCAESECESELRADAIAVGSHVADDADGLRFTNGFQNTIQDLRAVFHRSNDGLLFLIGGWRGHGRGAFQLVEDCHDFVATRERVVHLKFESRRVFQGDSLCHQILDADAVLVELGEAELLLFLVAEDADEYRRGFEITRAVHVVDGDEADIAHVELAADGFANGALEQLANSLETKVRHFE